jgi:hypothetical protein
MTIKGVQHKGLGVSLGLAIKIRERWVRGKIYNQSNPLHNIGIISAFFFSRDGFG